MYVLLQSGGPGCSNISSEWFFTFKYFFAKAVALNFYISAFFTFGIGSMFYVLCFMFYMLGVGECGVSGWLCYGALIKK